MTRIGERWLDLSVDLAETDGAWTGLFGDTDGNRENDLRTSDGKVLEQPLEFDQMYKVFAESWRVTNKTSLFTYNKGEDTEAFTDRTFPKAPAHPRVAPASRAAVGRTDVSGCRHRGSGQHSRTA